MSIVSKMKTFFALEDEEYEYEEQYVEEEKVPAKVNKHDQQQKQQNIVSLQSIQKSSKLVLLEPRAYADAQEIADHLKNRRGVVVNLQRISPDQARRIVDFLSGTVYAIGGDIQRIGSNIFLCTPDNVDVSGSISGYAQEDELEDIRW
ncbi:cell division protein SepF [Pradoshia sp. D12]|uniref:cell division protein SepF n=1 Tax=Bacillaceae TaxID=186817 RepID=UPI00080AE415|nr:MULTISPECIES: cell division protein SepF [Bacillaceae]OCA89703.1 cell division protein SepF [Bacillus sp. FJAT-27986]QFK73225.1 cell division protein SepF [Pradoshia sp. D12]TPF73766.1 cell division protein SepF [Bacillus sp. D12]